MSKSKSDTTIFSLNPQALQAVHQIAALAGLPTIEEAIRRAIGDELFIRQRLAGGWRIIAERNGVTEELTWPCNQ